MFYSRNCLVSRKINIMCILQDSSRTPKEYGVLDLRMGTSQKDQNCQTCGEGLADCIGHFGYIDLELPVFHVGYFRSIITVLQCICKSCCRILLKPDMAAIYRERTQNKNIPYLAKKALRKKVVELCKKVSKCHFCGEINGTVKKCGLLKISHEKFRAQKKTGDVVSAKLAEFDEAIETNKELGTMVTATGLIHVLTPLEVRLTRFGYL